MLEARPKLRISIKTRLDRRECEALVERWAAVVGTTARRAGLCRASVCDSIAAVHRAIACSGLRSRSKLRLRPSTLSGKSRRIKLVHSVLWSATSVTTSTYVARVSRKLRVLLQEVSLESGGRSTIAGIMMSWTTRERSSSPQGNRGRFGRQVSRRPCRASCSRTVLVLPSS